MNKTTKDVLFYVEKVDTKGNKHYSMASYSNITGMITYSSDYFFTDKNENKLTK